jgi:hypothetical protein
VALFPAVSKNPAAEAQKERRAQEKDGQSADMRNVSTQQERAKVNGVKRRSQQHLDRIARESPTLLAEVQAGQKSIHRAAVELGIVKEPPPLERVKSAYLRLDPQEQTAFREWLSA